MGRKAGPAPPPSNSPTHRHAAIARVYRWLCKSAVPGVFRQKGWVNALNVPSRAIDNVHSGIGIVEVMVGGAVVHGVAALILVV